MTDRQRVRQRDKKKEFMEFYLNSRSKAKFSQRSFPVFLAWQGLSPLVETHSVPSVAQDVVVPLSIYEQ